MNKYFVLNVLFIFAGLGSQYSIAGQTEYQFGTGLMAFNYAEYGDNNEFLDGETGFIPGLVLKRKQHHQRLYTEFVGQFYGATVEYDGQTQGGTPVKTDSIAIIIDTQFKLGWEFEEGSSPYLGLGYRYWYRKILNGRDTLGNPVSGLLEEYYWPYGMLGYGVDFAVKQNVSIGFDLRYTKMFNAKMDVDFLGFNGYDKTQVDLGNQSGLRFGVPVKVTGRKHVLIVTPYYEIIDIGKSNTVRLTSGGVPLALAIYEPRSETRNVGIELMWLW